jgi:hypothetical protein
MYQQGEFSIRTYVWFKPRLQRFGLFWSNRILQSIKELQERRQGGGEF